MQSSFEAAALAATSTDLVPMADALLKSAGFEDFDGGELMPQVTPEQVAGLNAGLPGPDDRMVLPEESAREAPG